MFHFRKSLLSIRFLCRPEDRDVIAPPVPAKTILPDWFRKLPAVDQRALSATNNGLTVKRCTPFLDAMTAGWILPLAATVRLDIKDGGSIVDAGWEFDRVMVSNHGPHQVAGNPKEPSPPCKFPNHWTISTPPGWSCLFVARRSNGRGPTLFHAKKARTQRRLFPAMARSSVASSAASIGALASMAVR
jgi:hypothetical protein